MIIYMLPILQGVLIGRACRAFHVSAHLQYKWSLPFLRRLKPHRERHVYLYTYYTLTCTLHYTSLTPYRYIPVENIFHQVPLPCSLYSHIRVPYSCTMNKEIDNTLLLPQGMRSACMRLVDRGPLFSACGYTSNRRAV